MAYVRNHGNQLAIVHGERGEDGKVQQRVLFTIYSKPEAQLALGRSEGAWRLDRLLETRYPRIRFDWNKIRSGIEERMASLPDSYAYKTGELMGRFRNDLCAFVRQLGVADPRSTHAAAELIRGHRCELEYLRDLIDFRLQVCEQKPNPWNGDNEFFWRHRVLSSDYPPDIIDLTSGLYARRELDRLEALARLFVDCYENYAEGHNYLGLVAQDRGDLEQAVEHFERGRTEGRKLFPKRIRKASYWRDLDTRPYMRSLQNLAIALMRLARYDEALEVCDHLDRKCGDGDAALSFRAHIYLNQGRWADAYTAADTVVRIWPHHAFVAAFAAFESGEPQEATSWFLHGVLTHPRTGRMLLGLRNPEPTGGWEIDDHNSGVRAVHDLAGYLDRSSRAARSFFRRVLSAPTARDLVAEREEVEARSAEEHRSGGRDAFDRRLELEDIATAREAAERVLQELPD